jgi:glucose-6-phosphate 1-dehydrogenase
VPFYLRTGKRMAERRSTVVLAFRPPPRQMFKQVRGGGFAHDYLALELGPNEGISATFLAKVPGPTVEVAPAHMDFRYDGSFGSELIEAYERLIHDALIGDRRLFTRADGIKRTWELVAEVLDTPPALHPYRPGSWGPAGADRLIAPRRWHLPPGRTEPERVVAPPALLSRKVGPPRSRAETAGATRTIRKRALHRDAREKV